jgi:hypothetical protein
MRCGHQIRPRLPPLATSGNHQRRAEVRTS